MIRVNETEEKNFRKFTEELAKLSKKYGVALQVTGGVMIGEIDRIEYDCDPTSGDLNPDVVWAEE